MPSHDSFTAPERHGQVASALGMDDDDVSFCKAASSGGQPIESGMPILRVDMGFYIRSILWVLLKLEQPSY